MEANTATHIQGLEGQKDERKENKIEVTSHWRLMWWRFRKHRVAVAGGVVTLFIYMVVLFAGFLAPFDANFYQAQYPYAPPQRLHFLDRTADGVRLSPYVYGYIVEIDIDKGRRVFTTDRSVKHAVRLFERGQPYKLLGLFPTDLHLFGPVDDEAPMFLMGTDSIGRDVFSRLIYGTQASMTIGLAGVVLSLFLGILLGGLSGYRGGVVDNVIQRAIEFTSSIPSIPLWMGLAAAIPVEWSVLTRYFFITVILSLRGWTGLARVVRGRFLALRSEDFVLAARLDGCGQWRIILYHMVPSFLSHIIAAVTLAIPDMILSETALSFLGLGMRPPAVSWGVLLQSAQNVRSVALAPWLLWPAVAVVIAVLALNFLGDGLRDAADPYG